MQASADTIFAVATGAARAAIAVIRVSGPAAPHVSRAFTGRELVPRRAALARLRDPATDETLDHALVLRFEAERSELGEDGVEFHLHGSPAVVAATLAALSRQPGLRAAEPGEFARRAFRNGRMDLAQLEALADLIDAETDWQRRQAQRQLDGALGMAVAPWRAALIAASADVETAIDFVEDVDLADALAPSLARHLDPVRDALRGELARGPGAERVRSGVQVVIAGPPNAGKSTLLNALVRREAAIVSALAGTTRDPIEVHLDLGGCPLTLIDTAGLRETAEPIEIIGVSRAREKLAAADLVLWLSADGAPPPTDLPGPIWQLRSKADLQSDSVATRSGEDALSISARCGLNMDVLLDRLARFAQDLARSGAEGLLTRERHRIAFAAALGALDHAAQGPPLEILAEDLRAARHALERLIGLVDVEDILDSLFSRFCIGK